MTAVTTSALIGGIVTLVATAGFALFLRPLALRVGLADRPGGRKKHGAPVPVIGGLAMATGLAVGLIVVPGSESWRWMLLAIWLLVSVGAIDDFLDLSAGVRLCTQAVAVILVVLQADLVVTQIGPLLPIPVVLERGDWLFTIVLVLAIVNGFNLIDGIDGFAGGTAFLGLVAAAALGKGTDVFAITILLVMAVAGFLVFNMPFRFNRKRRIFMGDAGSTMLGFAIACIGIFLSQSDEAPIAPVTMLWLVAIPLYEVIAAIWRRARDGRLPWSADDQHLHHLLLAHGISPRRALAFLLLLVALCAIAGIAGNLLELPDSFMFAAWLLCGMVYTYMTRQPRSVVTWVRAWKKHRSETNVTPSGLITPQRSGSSE